MRHLASSSVQRRIIGALLCALALAAAGCSSMKLAYDQAQRLTYWWLDGYFDFGSAQQPAVKAMLDDTWRWHRDTQLPGVVALLQRTAGEVTQPVDAAQVCRLFDDVMQRTDAVFEHMLPTLAKLAPTLSAAQLAHLEDKFKKNDRKFIDDFLQDDPGDRQKAAFKRSLERVEMLYGRIDAPQREVVTAGVARSPFDPQLALAERRRLHHDLLDTLRRLVAQQPGEAQAAAALRQVALRARQSPDPVQRAHQQRLVQYNCAYAAQLHESANAEQRRHAVKRLGEWADDLRTFLPGGSG